MNKFESLSGASILRQGDMEFHLMQFLKARGLLKDNAIQASGRKEFHYKSDEQLWNDIINKKEIYESQRIFLEEFAILDWVPQSPGLYHTRHAASARRDAENFIIERSNEFVVFDPYGKASMIKGGVGCLRVAIKSIGGHDLKFLCASKSGVAHKGIIVAMFPHTYSKVANLINTSGAVIANIVGEFRYWSHDQKLPFYLEVEVPRTYLLVEDVNVLGQSSRFGKLDVTAAVTFEGNVDGDPGKYFTYAHFDPARKESLSECINWMRVNYVEKRYRGKVLTDFDELISHFPDSYFPVKVLMNPQVSTSYISKLISQGFGIQPDSLVIEQLHIEGGIMSNITITGDGNVVGNNNQVVTTIHKGLASTDLRELGEAFALLKGEIIQLQNIPEKIKNRAVRAVEDAEDEAADKSGDKNTIVESLKRAKEVLEESGETYDKAKTWGKRLFDLGKTIVQYFPIIKNLITWL